MEQNPQSHDKKLQDFYDKIDAFLVSAAETLATPDSTIEDINFGCIMEPAADIRNPGLARELEVKPVEASDEESDFYNKMTDLSSDAYCDEDPDSDGPQFMGF